MSMSGNVDQNKLSGTSKGTSPRDESRESLQLNLQGLGEALSSVSQKIRTNHNLEKSDYACVVQTCIGRYKEAIQSNDGNSQRTTTIRDFNSILNALQSSSAQSAVSEGAVSTPKAGSTSSSSSVSGEQLAKDLYVVHNNLDKAAIAIYKQINTFKDSRPKTLKALSSIREKY